MYTEWELPEPGLPCLVRGQQHNGQVHLLYRQQLSLSPGDLPQWLQTDILHHTAVSKGNQLNSTYCLPVFYLLLELKGFYENYECTNILNLCLFSFEIKLYLWKLRIQNLLYFCQNFKTQYIKLLKMIFPSNSSWPFEREKELVVV